MTLNPYLKIYKTEEGLTRCVKKWLDTQDDLYYWKASDRFTSGIADIIVCVQGQFVALELKDDKGKLSANQKLFAKKVTEAGGVWAECRMVQDAIDAVNAARKKLP